MQPFFMIPTWLHYFFCHAPLAPRVPPLWLPSFLCPRQIDRDSSRRLIRRHSSAAVYAIPVLITATAATLTPRPPSRVTSPNPLCPRGQVGRPPTSQSDVPMHARLYERGAGALPRCRAGCTPSGRTSPLPAKLANMYAQ